MGALMLLAAAGVVAAALAYDAASSRRRASAGLTLALLWMMYTASKSLSVWVQGRAVITTEQYLEGSPLDRAFLMALMAAAVFVLANRQIAWPRLVRDNRWLLALFGYLALSVLWSNFPAISVKRWFRTGGDLLMALLVLTDERPRDAVRTIMRRTAIVLLPLSVVLIKFYRQLGVSYSYDGSLEMWTGVTTDKNTLGLLCAFTILFLLWDTLFVRERSKRPLNLALLLVAAYLLAGSASSRSATSVALAVVGSALLGFLALARHSTRAALRVVLIGTAAAVALPLVATLSVRQPFLEALVALLGRDLTFTGRVFLWDRLLEHAAAHRLLGVGYGGFWIGNTHNLWSEFLWGPTQGHNGYFDVYLELGLLGVALLCALVISAYRRIRRSLHEHYAFAVLQMLLLTGVLLHNTTESSFLRPTHFLWLLMLMMVLQVRPGARAPFAEPVSRRSYPELAPMAGQR